MSRTFEEEAKDAHYERLLEERKYKESIEGQAEAFYFTFRFWCRAYANSDFSVENLKRYIQEENFEFKGLLRKTVLERYFGYSYKKVLEGCHWVTKVYKPNGEVVKSHNPDAEKTK